MVDQTKAKSNDSATTDRHPDTARSSDGGETLRHNHEATSPVSAGGASIGYARVSRPDQSLDRQTDALRAAGCEHIFDDHGVSGAHMTRPGLDALLAYVRPGDTVVIQALDRLGRNTRGLLTLVEDLAGRGVGLRVLTLGVDTRTPAGQLVLTVMAALAAMEREILRERTRDGLAAARQRGHRGGRPPALTAEQVEVALAWHSDGRPVKEIARILGTSERTIRRRLDASPAPRSDRGDTADG